MTERIVLPPQRELLPDGAKSGGWWHALDDDRLVCDLCPRACVLREGDRGFCFVRQHRDSQVVLTTYGRSTGFCIDPIEKKPLNHFYPGTSVLSFGTAGCNLGCKFCQNHDISKSREVDRLSQIATPEMIVEAAQHHGCRSVAFTYNDPVVWAEYAIDTARACRAAGIHSVAVTAGYIEPEAREPFFAEIDAANVDLKGFDEAFYSKLTLSHLEPVLETLKWLHRETDVWLEITNLIIPQANDDPGEIRRMCDWLLVSVGDETPIHFTAFHPDFRMMDRERTPPETLLRAREIAISRGLKYVYVGNVDDQQHQSTYCAGCGQLLIERNWYELGAYRIAAGRCLNCKHPIPGRFDDEPGDWGRRRLPIDMARFAPASRAELPITELNTMREPTMADEPTPNSLSSQVAEAQSPDLSEAQRQAVQQAAAAIIVQAVTGVAIDSPDESLAGAASKKVMGLFVTLKRGGHLRGCCGAQGRSFPLGEALQASAQRTATEDRRFPPITALELPYLDLHVSVLYGRRSIVIPGEERQKLVEIGRHGLHIAHDGHVGLLLPQVAVEMQLDAGQFLSQVCIKADLSPTAWMEKDASLTTFESQGFGGALAQLATIPDVAAKSAWTREQIDQLANYFDVNLRAMRSGATPSYCAPNVPNGNVAGLAISYGGPEHDEAVNISRLPIKNTIPLQPSLFEMCQRLAGLRYLPETTLASGIAVLDDVAMHGTVNNADLRGIEPAQRAVLVREGRRSAWVFDPSHSAEELLAEAVELAKVDSPAGATVLSLAVVTNRERFCVVNVPRPRSGAAVRPTAVAGTFYPADADELAAMVGELFSGDAPPAETWPAVMVPHAGLKYSGRIAADTLRRVTVPSSVVVIGPKHTPHGVEWAVAPNETWSLPDGKISADPALAKELAESIDGLQLDAAAHEQEHAIEVELPLIANLNPVAKVTGITIGAATYDQCVQFARQLAEVLRDRRERTLLVISSDMNHFAADTVNRRLDAMAMEALETLDPQQAFTTISENQISMCGLRPAVIVLETLRCWGMLDRCERVSYATTADVTGNPSRVVGYAGMLFG